ncbi:plasmid partitioning protein RepB C-terminal domain-containing protein [Dyella sp. 2HG41-7]|uniref:plasmid partitioning protein RepB C-terminal domain-containing protein n=1 Tax=Dyella sp. 2HG41-7 TaxID=2883239 RepID=UPI001F2FC720|nr:plasmid partitioning protein RepB C-terminal domain-containing protein [Dyella sp. 2HG41-7]
MNASIPSKNSVPLKFESETRVISVTAIQPLKILQAATKLSQKYQQIAASIHAVGLVEHLVVAPNVKDQGRYLLLDGATRLDIIKDLGWTEVECLIATDDESYNYNKRVNRLAAVQEHRMIVRAVERGVPEERIAQAMNIELDSLRRRFRLLTGICPEVVEQLADKPCPKAVFTMLRRMKPIRQMEAAELMIGQRDYSTPFITAIWAATPDDQLVRPRSKPNSPDVSHEQIARLERELRATQGRTRYVEEAYSEDNLQLTIAKSYITKLLRNIRISEWLAAHQPEFLAEFRDIAEMDVADLKRK